MSPRKRTTSNPPAPQSGGAQPPPLSRSKSWNGTTPKAESATATVVVRDDTDWAQVAEAHEMQLLGIRFVNRRELLDQVARAVSSEPPTGPRNPKELRIGDDVMYGEGSMRGIVVGFGPDGDIEIVPTHRGWRTMPDEAATKTEMVDKFGVSLFTPPDDAANRIKPGRVTITHFSKVGAPVASEYISPHRGEILPENDITITNHGLGSGLYGFAEATDEHARQARDASSMSEGYLIEMWNPLHLLDTNHFDIMSELSKALQELARDYRATDATGNSVDKVPDWFARQPSLDKLTEKLMYVLSRAGRQCAREEARDKILVSMQQFFAEYYGGADHVAQPINFLLGQFGYDGIYSTDKLVNSWNRGSVAYNVKPSVAKKSKAARLYEDLVS